MQRATRQRAVIRDVIEQAHRPLAAREVLSEGRREIAGLGLATVYRALLTLSAAGDITAVQVAGDVARYALACASRRPHFRCDRCERVFDLEEFDGDLRALAPPGFEVVREDITLHGHCQDCTRARRPRGADGPKADAWPRSQPGRAG